jgi:uncharacterized cupredoxin-like copper-binding protein
MNKLKLVLAALALTTSGSAFAHGEKAHAPKEKKAISIDEKPFGREGDPRNVTRNIKVDMNDKMRFSPQALEIRRGEVVRFQVKNAGKTMHEMVLGTMQELKEHAELAWSTMSLTWRTSRPGRPSGLSGISPGRASSITAVSSPATLRLE